MANTPEDQSSAPEPRGFGEHTRRSSSENAHQQGWGLMEEERRQIPAAQQRRGGTDYDYGAQDFGDIPADTSTGMGSNPAGTGGSESQAWEGKVKQSRRTRRKAA